MLEAVLEDRLGDHARPLGESEERHHLGLHVGREARERVGDEVGRAGAVLRADPDPVRAHVEPGARRLQLVQHGAEVRRHHVPDGDVAPGDGAGHEEGAGLHAVGNDPMPRAAQLGHALDLDPLGPGAVDPRAHGREQAGEVRDLRLARRVLEDRRALGERGGHHEVLGARHRHEVEDDPRPFEPRGAGLHVALREHDLGAESLQPLQVEVDRPHPDGAAAGHGDASPARAGEQRAEDQDGRPHGGDELVRGLDGAKPGRPGDGPPLSLLDLAAQALQERPHRGDVGQAGHVLEHDRLRRQQGGGQERQRRVLRRADGHLAAKRDAPLDDEPGRH